MATSPRTTFDICVLPGDGIGVEVIEATLPMLEKRAARRGFQPCASTAIRPARSTTRPAARRCPQATFEAATRGRRDPVRRHGLAGDPLSRRHRDRAAARPALSSSTSMPACARRAPSRACRLPLADPRAKDIDLVLIRESTEGLFASRGKGVVEDDREARDTMVITRRGSRARARLRVPPRRAPQAARQAGQRDLRRQGQRVRLDGVLPQDLRRSGRAPPRRRRPTTTMSTRRRST